MNEINKMLNLYNRTLKNCEYYNYKDTYKSKSDISLTNEIGVLRGIAYCLELHGFDIAELPDFKLWMDIQQIMKNGEIERSYHGSN